MNWSEYKKQAIRRNRQIIKLYKGGKSVVEIARKYDLTRARVYQIVKGQKCTETL